jgi:hypothetical protein
LSTIVGAAAYVWTSAERGAPPDKEDRMNGRQGPIVEQATSRWQRPDTTSSSANGPPNGGAPAAPELDAMPDLSTLERSVRHLGSDWLGLARVIIACTNALLVALRRIERRLGG